MFQNIYTARGGTGLIAFASSFPGEILAIPISASRSIVAQKHAFLAMESGVDMKLFFQKRFGSGLFGGEGFIMQQFLGNGIVFLEIDGSVVEYELQAGQSMLLDNGYLAAMDATVKLEIEKVSGIGNIWRRGFIQYKGNWPWTYLAAIHANQSDGICAATVFCK